MLHLEILRTTWLPFIVQKYPEGHRFKQDDDPNHTSGLSGLATLIVAEHGVNWWKTVPESPDMSPMENVLHGLKDYIRRKVKPQSKDELVDGIKRFWGLFILLSVQGFV